MNWRPIKAEDIPRDLLVFDGDCVMCSRWARFVHARDPERRIRFVMLQSPLGKALTEHFGMDPKVPESNIFVCGRSAFFKSDSSLEVLAALPGWRWVRAFRVFPLGLRNWVYDRVARNRYAWFGRRERCALDHAGLRARIEADAAE